MALNPQKESGSFNKDQMDADGLDFKGAVAGG
jgi:hypothetical protein